MSEFRALHDGMSWADVWELRRARQGDRERGIRRPPPRERVDDGGYCCREVLAEIRLIVGDTARFMAEDPKSGIGALGAAEEAASVRDDARLRARGQVPLGEFAASFAGWLIRRADRGDLAAAVQAARLAASGSPTQDVLGGELRQFVRGYLDGSISGEEFDRRTTHPRAKLADASAAPTLSDDRATGALAASAAATLCGILAEVSPKGFAPDPLAAWEAFRRFAVLPVEPEAPERLAREGGDLLLCEWGVYEWPWWKESSEVFLVDLVRQFSVTAEDGEHDRVEQVHCSISFDPVPELRRLGNGAIWSGADPQQWFAEVEHSHAFVAPRTAPPLEVHVVGERL